MDSDGWQTLQTIGYMLAVATVVCFLVLVVL
jgi:hypothetical protein